MRNIILMSIFSILAALTPVRTVHALEVLSAEELASHCKVLPESPDSIDGQYCIRYIQGFLDGSIATDVRVMLNLEAEFNKKETFSERAIRTRSRDIKRASRYAEFCLGRSSTAKRRCR